MVPTMWYLCQSQLPLTYFLQSSEDEDTSQVKLSSFSYVKKAKPT